MLAYNFHDSTVDFDEYGISLYKDIKSAVTLKKLITLLTWFFY